MTRALGELTNHDVRYMRELYSLNIPARRIAEITGYSQTTVFKYVSRPRLYSRAQRYAAFVERASRFVPLLVPPSPF